MTYTDEEYAARIKVALERQPLQQQPLEEAFKALGFDPKGLGEEQKKPPKSTRKKTTGEDASKGLGPTAKSDPSPYAHSRALFFKFVFLFVFFCLFHDCLSR